MEMIDKLRELNKKLDDPYFVKEFEEGFEKFLKERDMKIYNTKTLEGYDELMIELEEKGYKLFDGKKPTVVNLWSMWKETTCLRVDNYVIFNDSLDCYREKYPNENIIEYKAKGAKMTQEEIKQKLQVVAKLHEVAFDISVAIGTFARGTLTVESNLSEAKSSAKKLIEKIDEYLESQEPEFKSGDIVASRIFRDASFSLVRLNEDLTNRITSVDGFWYTKDDCAIGDMSLEVFKEDTRQATPEEIAEYKVALNFHNHGRNPFEVKEGDLIESKSGRNIIILYPENYSRVSFLKDGWKLLKTAEEVNEWIRGE